MLVQYITHYNTVHMFIACLIHIYLYCFVYFALYMCFCSCYYSKLHMYSMASAYFIVTCQFVFFPVYFALYICLIAYHYNTLHQQCTPRMCMYTWPVSYVFHTCIYTLLLLHLVKYMYFLYLYCIHHTLIPCLYFNTFISLC